MKRVVWLVSLLLVSNAGWSESVGAYHWDFRQENGLKPLVVPDGKVRCGKQVGRVQLPEAFRFEAEFFPGVDWATAEQNAAMSVRENVLFDNLLVPLRHPKYNRGLYVCLKAKGRVWTPCAYFGFGDDVMAAIGPQIETQRQECVRIAFTFDAAGKVRWEVGGIKSISEIGRGGPVAASTQNASIGERACSIYRSFWGTIREVAITPIPREWVAVSTIGRASFVRGETNAFLTVRIEDFQTQHREVRQLPVETRLRPGAKVYPVKYGDRNYPIDYSIVPQTRVPFPIVAWGSADWSYARELGFTHVYDYALGSRMPRAKSGSTAEFHRRLDDAAKLGLKLLGEAAIGFYSDDQIGDEYRRIPRVPDAGGKKRVPEVSSPYFADLAKRTAIGNAEDFGSHPAFAGVNANTERVDNAYPSFNHEQELYERETGNRVPDEIKYAFGNLKATMKRYPDGIVDENDRVLGYYGWWWKDGNGWPRVNTAIADGYRQVCKRQDVFSFFDPAVRCPPRWGSGGKVDVLSQWVYANPEPLSVGGPAEELLAMIRGCPGQQAMIMTQFICYRSRLAPEWAILPKLPEWARQFPRAGFVTIPPDAFEEATWAMLAKPVKGIMYHGWGTVADTGEQRGYCFTNPETAHRVRNVLNGVVVPLGPVLAKLGRSEPEVAILESFTTAALGGPKGMGWSMPAYTFMERAHLESRIIYEEELLRDGWGNAKVLYLPQCRLLTPPVVAKIREFRAGGGIVIADRETNAGVEADVQVGVQRFSSVPKSDHREDVDGESSWSTRASELTRKAKADMIGEAKKLRTALQGRYQPGFDASDSELIVHSRSWQDVPYLFVINDHRDFGDYVGQWGLMMEKGLPMRGEIACRDPKRRIAAVYELSQGGAVKFTRAGDGIKIPVEFATTDGRLFALLNAPIGQVRLVAPKSVAPGEPLLVRVEVSDPSGHPIAALLPVEVRVHDALGRELDGGGWFVAENGVVSVTVQTNFDDPAGNYRIDVRDRASGLRQNSEVVTKGR